MYKAKILANLKYHGHKWVNPFIALGDVFNEDDSHECLRELIREGKVEKQMAKLGVDKHNHQVQAPLYRLAPNYTRIVDNPTHLSVVKK